MKLTMNIITRGRPTELLNTVQNTLPHVKREDTIMMISVDDDDQLVIDCLGDLPQDDRIKISIKPREDSRGEKYDRALVEHPADLYLAAVDCAPITTPGWDEMMIEAAEKFPDGIGCVYTPMSNYYFPGLQAPTAKLVEKMGWIYNHAYPFWFIDHELDDICRMIGRFSFVDVSFVNAVRPATTIRMHNLEFWVHYFNAHVAERVGLAHKIIDSPDFMDEPWRKEMLKTQSVITTLRSTLINLNVLEHHKVIEDQRGDRTPIQDDPGYLRILEKAKAKFQAWVEIQNRNKEIGPGITIVK